MVQVDAVLRSNDMGNSNLSFAEVFDLTPPLTAQDLPITPTALQLPCNQVCDNTVAPAAGMSIVVKDMSPYKEVKRRGLSDCT